MKKSLSSLYYFITFNRVEHSKKPSKLYSYIIFLCRENIMGIIFFSFYKTFVSKKSLASDHKLNLSMLFVTNQGQI